MAKLEPIKLLVVCGSLGVGGAEMQAARMLPCLDRNLFDVEVAYYNHAAGPPRDHLLDAGVPVTFLGRPQWNRAAYLRDAVRFMRDKKFDLVHAWADSANHYGLLPALYAGVPVVAGGLLGRVSMRSIWPWLYSLMSPFVAGWIVNSEDLKRFALGKMLLPQSLCPMLVVPNGIDLIQDRAEIARQAPFYAALKRGRPVVGLVARLHPVKNHAMLLSAAEILRGRSIDADYWIIGDGPSRQELEQQVRQRGLDDCVRLLGKRDDVEAAYEAMDLVVLTSMSEGCPNVLLEAMRASLPIISTRCTSLAEVVTEGVNGHTVAIDDAAELAERMAALLADPTARRRFGAASREIVERNFSMPVAVRRLEQAYLGFLLSSRVRKAPFREKLARLGVT